MTWKKLGRVYVPEKNSGWSHAQVPVAVFDPGKNIIKVYFASRDASGRSHTRAILVDADNPVKTISNPSEPILPLGKPGTFDDCGIMPSCYVQDNERHFLYYIGWNVRNTVPYHNAVGLAVSEDGGESFRKISEGPLWDRNFTEPYFSASTCVYVETDGTWRNWYLSCTDWREIDGRMEPRYHLKYAESRDGINWTRRGKIAVDYASEDEAGIVKATVVKEDGRYKLWYSYRLFNDYRNSVKSSYRIGYAESLNGIRFERKDRIAGITLSETGWDQKMQCYPHVIDVKARRLMFYNGNGFGQSGFGVAEWKT